MQGSGDTFQQRQFRLSFHCCGRREQPCCVTLGSDAKYGVSKASSSDKPGDQGAPNVSNQMDSRWICDYDPFRRGFISLAYVARGDSRSLATTILVQLVALQRSTPKVRLQVWDGHPIDRPHFLRRGAIPRQSLARCRTNAANAMRILCADGGRRRSKRSSPELCGIGFPETRRSHRASAKLWLQVRPATGSAIGPRMTRGLPRPTSSKFCEGGS